MLGFLIFATKNSRKRRVARSPLYPARLFEVADSRRPADWITGFGEEGERYAYPPPLNACGFFEDFFDDEEEAVATLWRIVHQRLATATAAV